MAIRLLIDTSAYSAYLRGHPEIVASVKSADEIYFNPVVLGELRSGFIRGNRRAANERELETFLSSPRVSILEIDQATSVRYAVILDGLWRTGSPIPTNDIWIAATAMQHGLDLLTTDQDFLRIPQIITQFLPA